MSLTRADIDAMLQAVYSAPKHEPDTLIVSPFFYDTMRVEIDTRSRFAGRDRRRIKRELRKAHALVKWKHKNQGRVMFAVDSEVIRYNPWRSREMLTLP